MFQVGSMYQTALKLVYYIKTDRNSSSINKHITTHETVTNTKTPPSSQTCQS